jgi:uncharacterized membrane protein HdeD (DUF308 family)
MHERRNRKWFLLGAGGLLSGVAALLVFRSLPMASGTAVTTVVAIIALKHLALFVAVSSPVAATLQTVKPRLRAICGQPPGDD